MNHQIIPLNNKGKTLGAITFLEGENGLTHTAEIDDELLKEIRYGSQIKFSDDNKCFKVTLEKWKNYYSIRAYLPTGHGLRILYQTEDFTEATEYLKNHEYYVGLTGSEISREVIKELKLNDNK